jgi:hypothetical protein
LKAAGAAEARCTSAPSAKIENAVVAAMANKEMRRMVRTPARKYPRRIWSDHNSIGFEAIQMARQVAGGVSEILSDVAAGSQAKER